MDFLGTTTEAGLVASVIEGVGDTTDVLAPFLIFVGVPIAFIVFGLLVGLIRAMISKDQSQKFLGFYVHKTPYKGYNRWRSEDWNRQHTS